MQTIDPTDRHVRTDLLLMLGMVLAFGLFLTALRMYDTKSGFVEKFSEKHINRFIKV